MSPATWTAADERRSTELLTSAPVAWADPLATPEAPPLEPLLPVEDPLATASPEVAEPAPQLKIVVMELMMIVIGAKFCPAMLTATFALVLTLFCATRPWACEAPLVACVAPPAVVLAGEAHPTPAHAAPEVVVA